MEPHITEAQLQDIGNSQAQSLPSWFDEQENWHQCFRTHAEPKGNEAGCFAEELARHSAIQALGTQARISQFERNQLPNDAQRLAIYEFLKLKLDEVGDRQ